MADLQSGAVGWRRTFDDPCLGFGDDRVNAEIAEAVEHHGLRLFIWDMARALMDRVRAAPHGEIGAARSVASESPGGRIAL